MVMMMMVVVVMMMMMMMMKRVMIMNSVSQSLKTVLLQSGALCAQRCFLVREATQSLLN